jgi:hypothetical protein
VEGFRCSEKIETGIARLAERQPATDETPIKTNKNMKTKIQLLKNAGITIRKNAKTGSYRAALYALSGATKCNQSIGEYITKDLAFSAARDTGIGRHDFGLDDWDAAK